VNQEANKAQDKPVLNSHSFQRLLAAAYMLQVHNDRQTSIRPVQHVDTRLASCLAAEIVVQKQNPAVMIRERKLQADPPDDARGNEMPKQHPYPAGPVGIVRLTIAHRMNVWLRRPMSWRTVEALAIAIVFFMIMGLSIHGLSAVPGRTSMTSGTLDGQNDLQLARPTEKVLASSQPVVTRNPRQSPGGREGDIVAEDIVIRHQKRAVELPGNPSLGLTFGRDADIFVADTVVQYGYDVKVWSKKPERATLNRPGPLSLDDDRDRRSVAVRKW
jgi:hypothetical protein